MARFSDSCQCGKKFRSMSAEAVHRHNFPALCRRKPKAEWEVVAGLEWTRKQDGTDNSGRPMYDYDATYKNGGRDLRFSVVKSIDAGFGISAYDNAAKRHLTSQQIEWRRSRKRCFDRAVEIMAVVRREKTNGAASGEAGS